jgi:hypothetical protein
MPTDEQGKMDLIVLHDLIDSEYLGEIKLLLDSGEKKEYECKSEFIRFIMFNNYLVWC